MPGFDRRQRSRNSSRRSGRRFHSSARNGSQVINLNSTTNSFNRGSRRSNGNATKLYEKYSKLASEALATGDKILAESYFQHADHFLRISNDKDRNFTKNTNDEQRPNNNIETSENNEAKDHDQDSKNII